MRQAPTVCHTTKMNDFFCITSNGGYIGRFSWVNSGINCDRLWGEIIYFNERNLLDVAWAGELWIIRAMIR